VALQEWGGGQAPTAVLGWERGCVILELSWAAWDAMVGWLGVLQDYYGLGNEWVPRTLAFLIFISWNVTLPWFETHLWP
jgi:hypothetical protein